ncbi:hypothetical protein ELQ90_04310 [Labedella phragmitis]|uniref:PKD domain-containing protein n=1 Tax=Labedella phragmitis TaxID=2498849 RepID=A0A3S4APP0_9MICO|nr:hypothetical protein [Labedella phragmitis]RWZ53152.1 hypothetical protein ELQ90_04310 [Labedella phragmitis]
MGLCSNTDGSSVDLTGEGGGAGRSQPDRSSPTAPSDGTAGVAPGASEPSIGGDGLGGNPRQIVDVLDGCPVAAECTEEEAPDHPVTLADLASFSPSAAVIRMEPSGWMLTGLPANFIADTAAGRAASEETEGRLLERPISVRFTPTSYTWSWGDGSSDTVATAGRTWDELGVPRFTETATSHVYDERGTVTVSLEISYRVEYSLGGAPWTTVAGTVATGATIGAYVGTARTVLVDGDCIENPDDPGC